MRWTTNRCSCGGGDTSEALFPIDHADFGAASLMRCPGCGALFPDRLPDSKAMPDPYEDHYTRRPKRRAGAVRRLSRALGDRGRCDYLARDVPAEASRILDFGCGSGAWLSGLALRRPDAQLHGTDLVRPADPDVPFEWLADAEVEAAEPFDWITLGHVLEHHPDPAALLTRLKACLAPGGGLWIATPNADSFLIAAAGRWARDIDFPRHRELFSRAGLTHLLARAGLTAEFQSPPPINAVLNTVQTLDILLRDRGRARGRRAVLALAIVERLARHVLTPPARRDPVSPELVVVARQMPG